MAGFTYDLNGTGTALLVSKVRMHLGDTVENEGVLPDGSNLTDDEVELMLSDYSSDIDQTVGALCSILARRWAGAADIAVGPRRENLSQISKRWAELAAQLNPEHQSFVTSVQRSDAWADHADLAGEYADDDD